ncbi:MAG: hypothetical protein GY945_10245, partial [Rhodobacteraceae bacterium]|nr:hypothetical protein [Paracoccaceae bacterium]
ALPVLALMALALGLPYLWAFILPEGIPGLLANFVLSAVVIAFAVLTYFVAFYAGQNAIVVEGLLERPSAFAPYALGWIAKAALAWLPMLILGVAAQPKRWKEVVW